MSRDPLLALVRRRQAEIAERQTALEGERIERRRARQRAAYRRRVEAERPPEPELPPLRFAPRCSTAGCDQVSYWRGRCQDCYGAEIAARIVAAAAGGAVFRRDPGP